MKTLSEKLNYILGAGLIICLIYILFQNCTGNEKSVTMTKDKVGKFDAVKPEQVLITANSPQLDSKESVSANNAHTQKSNPVNDKEKEAYKKQVDSLLEDNKNKEIVFKASNDSLKGLLYKDALSLKSFNQTLDDSLIRLDLSGLVRGTIESLKVDSYKLKSHPTEIPKPKETVFRLNAGVDVGMTKTLSGINVIPNISFQFKNGSSVKLAADTEKRIYVGYSVSVFRVQR